MPHLVHSSNTESNGKASPKTRFKATVKNYRLTCLIQQCTWEPSWQLPPSVVEQYESPLQNQEIDGLLSSSFQSHLQDSLRHHSPIDDRIVYHRCARTCCYNVETRPHEVRFSGGESFFPSHSLAYCLCLQFSLKATSPGTSAARFYCSTKCLSAE